MGKMPLSFNYHLWCDLETQWQNIHLPPVTFCRRVTPNDDRVSSLYTPSVTVVRSSSEHARIQLCMPTVWNSEGGGGNFKTSLEMCTGMDVSPLCYKVAYKPQTVVGQGRFFSRRSATRDITCSVKGVFIPYQNNWGKSHETVSPRETRQK